MNRRNFIALSSMALAGCNVMPTQDSAGVMERAAAELIRLSVNNGIERLANDTLGDVQKTITLPAELGDLRQALARLGVADYLNKIEQSMRQGVQSAAVEVKPFLLSAANQITPLDAAAIFTGKDSSATDYVRRKVGQEIENHFSEKLGSALSKLDFYADYKKLQTAYALLPLSKKPNLDIESQLVTSGVNVMFDVVAQEEMNVRKNPEQAASAVLQAVL